MFSVENCYTLSEWPFNFFRSMVCQKSSYIDEKTLELSIHSEHSFLYKMCEGEVNLNRLQQRKKCFLRFVLLSNKNKSMFKIGFQ